MKEYCIGCLYCRPLNSSDGTYACHYYLDTGNKPPYTDTGCKARKPAGDAERAAQLTLCRATGDLVAPRKRRAEDDYIFDSRGALDGWYPARED